jgi:hypothetical protein
MNQRSAIVVTVMAVLGLLVEGAFAKNKKNDPEEIGDRNIGKGVNFYSLEKEIALGKQLAQEVSTRPNSSTTQLSRNKSTASVKTWSGIPTPRYRSPSRCWMRKKHMMSRIGRRPTAESRNEPPVASGSYGGP